MGNKGQKTSRLRKTIRSTLNCSYRKVGRQALRGRTIPLPATPKPEKGQHDLLAKGHSPVLAADDSREPAVKKTESWHSQVYGFSSSW